jgi:hypothetical protein
LLLLALAACRDGDASRPNVDVEPYYIECGAAEPCPEPYECTAASAGHEPGPPDVCLVPCNGDGECPDGFFCNGVETSTDVGALDHCVEDV